MGRNIPWRKALIISLSLLSFNIHSEPILGKIHQKFLKNESNYPTSTYKTQNIYKQLKIYNFNIDIPRVIKQYEKNSPKIWEKYLNITYNRFLPYRDYIIKEAEKQNIPYELIYLPIIESGASSMATSRRGATGLWQFMANSSGAYNMKTTDWLDERRDFTKSTIGALSKLKYNYKVTGDWLLALAAYNCGLSRVKKVVKKTGISDFWELAEKNLLPRETINYIPKFLLISSLLQEKNRFNIPINWEQKSWSEVDLSRAVDIRLLANKADIPFKILKEANSELIYNVTPPINTNYKLKVPSEYTDKILGALQSQEKLMEFYRYKVKSGDTLSEIGYHYGISTRNLISYNPGVSARNLRIGKTIIIPAIKEVEPMEKYKSKGPFKNDYIVKDGDTLWGISLMFDTTVEEIAINSGFGINSYIKEGMSLKVP
ncbi:MAG: LysM peptidoglycan-binding domain-containing protein [Spirochaetaceae bacterium]